jgi:glycosyltransferase involved in cell wall biosynthesis
MACGLPVIACEGSGAAEVVIHGENGFLVPPNDLEALIHALQSILDDPYKRALMGVKARKYVLEKADSRTCIQKLEAFFKSVASKTCEISSTN